MGKGREGVGGAGGLRPRRLEPFARSLLLVIRGACDDAFELTASSLSLPDFTYGSAVATLDTTSCICPPISAMTAPSFSHT